MRRELCRPDAHASGQGAANDNGYPGGTAPHPYPPRRFAGGGGRSALIASPRTAPTEFGMRASIADKWVCIFKRGTGAGVPLPPRRSRGGEGTGGGRFEMTREPSPLDPRVQRARALRRDATPAERRLWRALRLVEVSEGHFRRQAPIGPYVADFANHSLRLVVELDGEQHGHSSGLHRDARRTAYLTEEGYSVIRFWNHEVMENLDGVVETILAAVAKRADASLPRGSEPRGQI